MTQFDLASYDPALRYGDRDSQTWAANGNTHTVTNSKVTASSLIFLQHTSDHDGRWYITVANGSFTITSSDAESTSVTFNYLIF